MKDLIKHEQAIGADGAQVAAKIGVEGVNLKAELAVTYPIEKIVEPAVKVINDLVDKLEQFIPGDQTGMAAQLKADAKEALVKALSEQV